MPFSLKTERTIRISTRIQKGLTTPSVSRVKLRFMEHSTQQEWNTHSLQVPTEHTPR